MNSIVYMLVTMFPDVILSSAQGGNGSGFLYDETPGVEFSLFWSTAKVILALGLTLILLVTAVWILKKVIGNRTISGISGGTLRVLEIRYIAPKKSIALIRVMNRVFIVGISDQSLTTLGELLPEEIENLETATKPESPVFENILRRFSREKNSG